MAPNTASSSKNAQTSIKTAAPSQAEHDASVLTWAKSLYDGIKVESTYAGGHQGFFEEFDRLRDASKARGDTTVTLIDHVSPIYNHVASQGYQPNIHFGPLQAAVYNWCKRGDLVHWQAPPDQPSRTPTPTLASPKPAPPPSSKPPQPPASSKPRQSPASSRPPQPPTSSRDPKVARMTISKVAPTASGSKTVSKKKYPSAETVRSDQDESDEESVRAVPRPPPRGRQPPRALPPTLGLETHITKCMLCDQRGHGCHINPKATTALATCFKCHHWKLGCSLAARPSRKSQPTPAPRESDDESLLEVGKAPLEVAQERAVTKQEEKEKPVPKMRATRKKPSAIPTGEQGQYGSTFFTFLIFFCY